MTYTQILREFWTVPTLERAKHERVTVPPQPDAWSDEVQAQVIDRVAGVGEAAQRRCLLVDEAPDERPVLVERRPFARRVFLERER